MGNRRMGTYHVAQLSRATGPDENHITAAATDDLRELVLGQRGAVEELAGADGVAATAEASARIAPNVFIIAGWEP
jgi:hypothetical protein